MEPDFQKGVLLLLNKPIGWTSFDLVKKVRNLTKAKKVGHAGTLDPLASGLMILCTGKMTSQLDFYQAEEKEYTGTIFLGETTPGYDREMPADTFYEVSHINEDMIRETARKFTGMIEQHPPPHSAVKIGGKRAYELARQGRPVETKARLVEIKEFEIVSINLPVIHFRIVCSKGTYIRSLTNDFGKAMNSGACLDSLTRTRIGNYRLESAVTIEQFAESLQNTFKADS